MGKQTSLYALNPFMPGAGMRPPELVGRDKDLEAVDRMVARTKDFTYSEADGVSWETTALGTTITVKTTKQ